MTHPFAYLNPSVLGCLSAAFLASAAAAETPLPDGCTDVFNGQRITVVVPNAAGGGYDLYARAFAPILSEVAGASALVSNMPGGGGKAALVRTIAAPPSEMVVLFDSANDIISSILADPSLKATTADLEIMGIIHSEPDIWLGRPDLDLADPAVQSVVSASAMIESNLIPVDLAAKALGIEAHVVAGYGGSAENVAAILRGEADVSSISLTSGLRATESSETKVLLLLAAAPHPKHPDIPWLGGEDGLVAQRSVGLPEAERAERMANAQIVIALSNNPRTLFAPASMESASKACLKAAIETVLTSTAFSEAAMAKKRPVTPLVGPDAVTAVAAIETAYVSARPMLDAMLKAKGQ